VKLRPLSVRASATALAAATLLTACGATEKPASPPQRTTAAAQAPPAFHGEAARVADAVAALGQALRGGDVLRLCRRGAIFTPAVVEEMGTGGATCEASVEDLLASGQPPTTAVVAVELEPRLATAKVRVSPSTTVALTLLRDRHRWLISFSDGNDPLVALIG
jgi:hypothetical protein